MTQNYLSFLNFCDLFDWSVTSSSSNLQSFKYPLLPLKKYLNRVKERVEIEDDVEYKQITVRLYGQGVLQRCVKFGKEIGTKKQFIARAGQLIISRIDARNGAFGIVPDFLDGAIVTNDFWLFDVIGASAEFLMLLLSSQKFQQYWQALSTGTTNRQRVSESIFLECKVPMPDFEEQINILSQYKSNMALAQKKEIEINRYKEEITNALMEYLGVSSKISKNANEYLSFSSFSATTFWGVDKNLNNIDKYYDFSMPVYNLSNNRNLVECVFRGKSPVYKNDSNCIILNQKCNRWNYIDGQHAKTVDEKWYYSLDKSVFLKENDIIVNSTGEGTLGRASLVTSEYVGYLIDSHMLVLRLNEEYLMPEFIVMQINSIFGQKQVELLKGAQATKQTELGVDNLLKMKFVIPMNEEGSPDLNAQKYIISEIKKIEKQIQQLSNQVVLLCKEANQQFEHAIFG